MIFDESEHVKRDFSFEVEHAGSASNISFTLFGWENPTKGDIVWRGAWALADELAARGPQALQGKTLLELGAGCGLLGAVAAKLGAIAVISDGDEAEMPLLHRNAELISDTLMQGGQLAATYLEWGNEAANATNAAASGHDPKDPRSMLHRHGFDFVVGSDIAYMPKHIPELAETIAFFLAEQGEALIVNTAVSTMADRSEAAAMFRQALRSNGLVVADVGLARTPSAWPVGSYFLRISHQLPSISLDRESMCVCL